VEKKTRAAKLKKSELGGNEKLWIGGDDAPRAAKVGSRLSLAFLQRLTHGFELGLEGIKDRIFNHLTRFLVQRMSNIAVLAIFALLAGHRYKQPAGALNDL
jgi:hypothetical protein